MRFHYTLYGTWKILAVAHNDNVTTIQLQSGVNSNLIINKENGSRMKKFIRENALVEITVEGDLHPLVNLQVVSSDDVIFEQDMDD